MTGEIKVYNTSTTEILITALSPNATAASDHKESQSHLFGEMHPAHFHRGKQGPGTESLLLTSN